MSQLKKLTKKYPKLSKGKLEQLRKIGGWKCWARRPDQPRQISEVSCISWEIFKQTSIEKLLQQKSLVQWNQEIIILLHKYNIIDQFTWSLIYTSKSIRHSRSLPDYRIANNIFHHVYRNTNAAIRPHEDTSHFKMEQRCGKEYQFPQTLHQPVRVHA